MRKGRASTAGPACPTTNGAAPGFQCALLVRRSVATPTELTFHLTHVPEGAALGELVRVAGTRWSVESLFEQAKGEVGLGHYEVRSRGNPLGLLPGWAGTGT